ncbi:MAG: NPXTG-anchored protein, partial [Ruminococcus sp.]|nr:NPXTG-anchored protein [Ruminococcus sp.]
KDEEWVVKGLTVGETYSLTETTAPDGYEKAETIYFKVDKDGNVTVSDKADGTFTAAKDGKVVMVDDYSKKTVNIRKEDIGGDLIDGAKLIVSDAKGTEIAVCESTSKDSEWTVTGLTVGEVYKLTEETAPDGYVKAEDIYFKVDKDGSVTVSDKADGEFSKPEENKVVMVDKEEETDESNSESSSDSNPEGLDDSESQGDSTGDSESQGDGTHDSESNPDSTGDSESNPDSTGDSESNPDSTGDSESNPDSLDESESNPDSNDDSDSNTDSDSNPDGDSNPGGNNSGDSTPDSSTDSGKPDSTGNPGGNGNGGGNTPNTGAAASGTAGALAIAAALFVISKRKKDKED